jgi:hypothetical protein
VSVDLLVGVGDGVAVEGGMVESEPLGVFVGVAVA